LIYVDAMIIIHTNESEFQDFMNEKKYEAYHDRMVVSKATYNTAVSNEVKIYEKLLANTDATKNMHIAPKTLESAAIFATLTRLTPQEGGDLTLIKKMKLYDSKNVKGFKISQVPDIKKKDPNEAMSGVSPRFVNDQITAAISKAKDEDRDYITTLDVLRQLNTAIIDRDSFKKDQKNLFISHIDSARAEWNDMLRNDIQKAFFVSFEAEAKSLCEKYLDHVDAACSGQKPRDPVTEEEIEIDEFGHELIALYQPTAADLRLVTMVLKITNDLERIGDQAVNIAEAALIINQKPPLKPYEDLPKMALEVRQMVRDSLSAFMEADQKKATLVLENDDQVDRYNDQIYDDIQSILEDNPKFIRTGVGLMMVSHNLERVADLATNIAEDVIYIVKGKTIKHHIDDQN